MSADINCDGTCVSAGPNGTLDTTVLSGDDTVDVTSGIITSGVNRMCETSRTGDDKQEHAVGFTQPDEVKGFEDWHALKYHGGGTIGIALSALQPAGASEPETPIADIFAVIPKELIDEVALAR